MRKKNNNTPENPHRKRTAARYHRLWLKNLERRKGKYLSVQGRLVVLSVLTGLVSGLAAVLLKNLIVYVSNRVTGWRAAGETNWLLLFLPMTGVVLSFLLVKYVFKDKISHGVSRVMEAFSRSRSRFRRSKMYSSLVTCAVTIGFGGSVGPEAPVVLSGAAIGSNIGRMFNLSFRELIILTAGGCAGAIAGIFNAPLAGMVFTLEVLMIDLTMSALIPILTASVTGAVTSAFLMGGEAVFHFNTANDFLLRNLPFYLVLGLFGGLVSCYFLFMNERLGKFFAHLNRDWKRVVIGGLGLCLLVFVFPPLYGEGLGCLGDIFTGDTDRLFNNSFLYGKQDSVWVFFGFILLLILLKGVAMSFTNGAGGVGGVFAPSLFVGGFTGLFTAQGLNVLFGLNLPVGNFALAGMAALMAGVMHAPLTAVFLVAEITGGYNFFIPLMVVSASAYIVSRHFNPHSIYTKDLAQRGALLTHNKDAFALSMLSMERIIETNFISVRPDDSLGDLVQCISRSSRNLYPVTDADGTFLGIVFLDDVKTVIFRRELYDQVFVRDIMYKPRVVIQRNENMEQVAKRFARSDKYNIPVLDGDKYVGFISRANVFSSYRAKVREYSSD